jgi:hypothetical protein
MEHALCVREYPSGDRPAQVARVSKRETRKGSAVALQRD